MPTACLLCRQHKKKCEGSPCARCSTYGVTCTFPEVARQPRAKVAVVKRKLEKIESLVHTLNITNLTQEELKLNLMKNMAGSKRSFISSSSQVDWTRGRSFSIPELFSFNSSPKLVSRQMNQPLLSLFKDKLLDTYVKYVHTTFPFVDLDKLYKIHSREKSYSVCFSPLLNAVYCRGFRFLQHQQSSHSPSLDQDYFYQLCLRSLATSKSNDSLEHIQAEIILAMLEFSQDEVALASRRTAKIIAVAHSLHLQDPEALCHQPFGASHDYDSIVRLIEKATTWAACISTDFLVGLLTKTPPLTNAEGCDLINNFDILSRLVDEFSKKENTTKDDGFFNFDSDTHCTPSSPTKSTPEMSHASSSPSSSSSEIGTGTLTLEERMFQFKRLALIPQFLSIMHSAIDYSSTVSPAQSQSEKVRLSQLVRETRSILPASITSSYLSSTTIEQDPNLIINFILYLTCHSICLQIGIKLVKIANLPPTDGSSGCGQSKSASQSCSGKKSRTVSSPSSCSKASFCMGKKANIASTPSPCSKSSCSSKSKCSSFNTKAQGSQCRSQITSILTSTPGCLAGRQLCYQSAKTITQAFTHSQPDYWSPYAVSSLLLPSSLVLVLMASKSDPASDAASSFKIANQLFAKFSTAWPVFGSPLEWGDPIHCDLDHCPSKLPASLSC